MKTASLLLIALFFIAYQLFATQLGGTVFHDLNGNGKLDDGEPGLPQVAVSNGRDVVLTDLNGRYEIGLGKDQELFVIKPSNFNYPVNEQMLPQFYYLPQPQKQGTQAAEKALSHTIDFPLLSGDDRDDFRIIVFADPQTYTEEEVGYYNNSVVKELSGLKDFTFGITLGDMAGDDLALIPKLNQATAGMGLPWFHLPGNHDLNYEAPPYRTDETFIQTYGPSTYAFNQGKVHFIVLNNVLYPNTYTAWQYVGGLHDDQLLFIENSLAHVPNDHLVVLCMHIPLYNVTEWGETFVNEHRLKIFDLLRDRPYTFSMSGHMHRMLHHFFDEKDGWPGAQPHHHLTVGAVSGDWWSGRYDEAGIPDATMNDGTPNGYAIIHFRGSDYRYDYKVYGQPASYKMRIYGPKLVPRDKPFRGEFYVNFFQGSSRDTVSFSVSGGEWQPMRHTYELDPHVCAMRYEWDMADELPEGRRPSNPVLSSHLWKARVPTNLDLGENTIQVRVKDMYGRVYEDSFTYTAVDSN